MAGITWCIHSAPDAGCCACAGVACTAASCVFNIRGEEERKGESGLGLFIGLFIGPPGET